ncbi:MAG: carbohydrate binding family 9 domain-containing protein [Candidatus Marinimicrobia bacterium]|nr:carbohydrate binding family 9 domain-containing protein [Candidatus Neomarinimicrobiota bacterium]MBT4662505.1 carbohydrate binding family 9 domain-containing protein [Candidatus Neomarinimicrobiota bacterium]MBT4736195.1 carbohydrate binding family 9 domain-containing protein [Candidatus Neomarinimicrobiota bacterium]MBT5385375.1 carbohydrate binding family 9 domain-containing protein [Candidatus Neomarinimicrobiota bacterium]MBT6389782.1 carbohydrate binding family 9 domain-containing prot
MKFKRIMPILFGIGILGAGAPKSSVKSEDLQSRIFEITRTSDLIEIDGDFDDKGWQKATTTNNFLEFQPGDNINPTEETEVKLTYDKNYLYVAFTAYSNPEEIRASFQKRDQAWGDDFVAIVIDTYGDANSAIMIASNPYGIQMDALNQGDNEDESFDIIYESKGKITDEGYQVEMAIPFSSLSFPKKHIQEWKITFYRSLPRSTRSQIVWGGFDRSNPCWLCQLGTLKGIEGIEQKDRIEFLPTVVGAQSSELDNNDEMQSANPSSEASLGVKYSFSSDRTAEVTINPDFSQVEADEDQVDVNTTFALSFREKRPFFNEGADLMDTWINAIYTRSINNPIAAGRIINRGQKNTWALLSAMDEDSPYIIPGEERSYTAMGKRSLSNIFRYKRSLDSGSYFGLLATNRQMMDNEGSGSVFGFDTRYRFNDMYQLEFQTVFSHTKEPNDSLVVSSHEFGDGHSFTFDGESFTGNAVEVELSRETEHWILETGYDHNSPTFRAENGFIRSNNNRRAYLKSIWIAFPNSFVTKAVGGINTGVRQNFDGESKSQYIAFFGNVELPRQFRVNMSYNYEPFARFKETKLKNLSSFNLNINSSFSKSLTFGGGLNTGEYIVRFLDTPKKGKSSAMWLWGQIKITDKLMVSPRYNTQKMTTLDGKEEYFSGYLASLRVNYQFNESFGFKLLGQYNDFSNSFTVQPLLTYQPSPFTIFYIGSSQNQFVNTLSMDAIENGRLNSRQYFMKFQYLFN